ncbi:hypothetical protein HYFRA_00014019 [Hymenoscyphus fraxineus]|uniref:Serine/threonine-protein kinase BUR1 n=1 Tax=Hymenoscyphus fraxineus TaxID=746836 RepID=A0A9N9LC95_9HELO|nr:hypothetical protein HYFRA_00014019 [Hymenoscyphus fraxineus]
MAASQLSPQSNGVSPRSQSATRFRGCSRITDYDILGKLGEGTFGEVHRAKSKKTGAVVALKKILMHNEKDGFPITALREIKLLKLLSHPNILRLEEMAVEHHAKTDKDKRKRAIMYMVTPYMDHDLSGLLENPDVPKFTEPQIKCYMIQLLEGLAYLHDNHILHRDMKAANLLINNKGILQIADFGLARHYDGPVPVAKNGGGEGMRDYTTLVVTRWYRPPELLLGMRRYTTAIDLWGVGCVFGEMLYGKPILSGDSDQNQLKIIFDLVGTPTETTMPGWRHMPNAEGLNIIPKPKTLHQRFRAHGSGACQLLDDLLNLDYRTRLNAIDALEHPYFKARPLPAKAGDIPMFESSHELDRRKNKGQKAGPPPAPKGGTVGMGPNGGWGEAGPNGNQNYSHNDGYGRHHNGSRYPPPPHGGYGRNGVPPPPPPDGERRPAWRRDDRPDPRGLPPRPPPPGDYHDNMRADGRYRSASREVDRPPLPRSRAGGGPNVDTYIPSYGGGEGGRRDDRRRRDDRDERRLHVDRDYDDRSRSGRTRSRSRSPVRERDRERVRDREDRDREMYRR